LVAENSSAGDRFLNFGNYPFPVGTYDADNRRGDYPEIAPLGYLNDVRIKKIVIDRKRSKIVRQAF